MPGLARALSKLGYCSRSQAVELIRAGRVSLNGRLCRDPERPVVLERDRFAVDEAAIDKAAPKVYVMLNKPRGLVTTTSDEKGRATVYECLRGSGVERRAKSEELKVAHLAPVGRLDKASEGLLLFTNDTAWAHRLTDPATHLDKTYHVQVDCLVDEGLLGELRQGSGQRSQDGQGRGQGGGEEGLAAKSIRVLRLGGRNSWLEIVLDEGKNRQIRRLLEGFGIEVLRLVRVAIGGLELGELAKGAWRELTPGEVEGLNREFKV